MADIEADVIIVGSGVSGALLAAKLSQAGVRVAILEAGARVDRAEATQRFWNSAIRVPECPYPPSPEADHPINNDPDYWYRQSGPDKFKSTYLKVVGGIFATRRSAKTGRPSASSSAMTAGHGPKAHRPPPRQTFRGSVCAMMRSTVHCATKPHATFASPRSLSNCPSRIIA
jgi:choline dehydrogenase-like flavoprotein